MKLVQLLTTLASYKRRNLHSLVAAALFTSCLGQSCLSEPAQAQSLVFCHESPDAIAQKENLRQNALKGSKDAEKRYKTLLADHADRLRKCRSKTWPQTQAIWIRLYPCDVRNGELDGIMDRIVNRGYNAVYVEAFYNGQVLLPSADNRTSWPSSVRTPGAEKVDLLAEAIRKGHERGLSVYTWMFSMNFGYTYAQKPDKRWALAQNGYGQTSLSAPTNGGLSTEVGVVNPDEAFIDPYNPQARRDYYQMAQAIAQRKPDGMLFDYIRYPRGVGTASVVSKVQDLWIYGAAAQQALYQRALNNKGQDLIRRFISKGYITAGDVVAIDKLYPKEGEPLWQGRNSSFKTTRLPASERQATLQWELWQLSVAHALQGVLDFLANAVVPAQQQGIPAGVVFFPEGNQSIGRGFDSRLQPWDRFPSSLQWHPMSYGVCGSASCIVAQVQRVLSLAPPGTQVKPVLAGIWQQSISNRPPLEVQMQALHRLAPRINSVSHFAYSWQEPQSDRDRKFCRK